MRTMKKTILLLCGVLGVVSMQAAINDKYSSGYELKSLELNTAGNETHLSVYANDQLLYLNDGKVFVSALTEGKDSLLAATEDAALDKLGIQGTVAFDAATNQLYYSLVESETTEWLYVSTLKDGKFTATKRLEIEGMGNKRGNNAFMANAGWSYISKTESILQNPALAKNGTRLYFTSATIENGKGGKDLWYIDLKKENQWSAPVNAGDSINTASDEDFAFVENDELLYFSSNASGIAHLYMAKSADGAWEKAVQMPEPYTSAVEDARILVVEGNPFVISNRNIGNGSDIFAFVKVPCDTIVEEVPEEPKKEFNWVYFLFDFDKATLTAQTVAELDTLVASMSEFPDAQFEISGYTDARGSHAYNDKLSERRALAIQQALVERGIAVENLRIVANGKRALQVPNATSKEQHAQNRRVEVRIINPENN